jgi:PAS domain S-box-containing protein
VSDLPSHHHAHQQHLRLILSALQDGVILIEPDQTVSWANKAALKMHGVTQLAELGATASEYRTRFELRYRNRKHLPKNGYPMERVLAGEAFDDVVVEVARAGENEARWIHRIRSLVLTDGTGVPDCLVLILNDETERFDAEARFEATFAANPAPAVILRLADHRFIKVNEGFLKMTGYKEQEVLGRSAYEIDVLEGSARREFAIERLQHGRTIPQVEAVLQLPGGGEKRVIVAGQPIEVANADCMLFTFVDLSRADRSEEIRRQSEENFATAVRLAPAPALIVSRKACQLLAVNEAFTHATGYAAPEVTGRTVGEIGLWGDVATAAELEHRLERDGRVSDHEIHLQTKEFGLLHCRISAEPLVVGHQACVLMMAQDITETRRAEGEVVAAIEAVMQDTAWFTRAVLEKLKALQWPETLDGQTSAGLSDLSARGRDVLNLVCRGLDDAGVARKLGISQNTVRNHITALYRRTGVHSRAALVVWARERGFTGAAPRKTPLRKG